jgi:ethanolamine permease
VFPATALIISTVCLFAIIWFNLEVSGIFFAGLGVVIVVFIGMGKHKIALTDEMMMAPEFTEVR